VIDATALACRHHAFDTLLVEDSPADAQLFCAKLRPTTRDGVGAFRILRRDAGFADAPSPDLNLLDLSLPCSDGREVLEKLRADAIFREIPGMVLTSSVASVDVEWCSEHTANALRQAS